MDFLNKLGDSLQSMGKEVSKKTKDFGGTVSLNSQIKESENNLNKLYQLLGQRYYQEYKEESCARYEQVTQQIAQIQEKIAGDREQLRALKGLKICKNCGTEIDMQALHCPMCGTAAEVPASAFEPETVCCPGCGAQVVPGTKFCGKCGTKLDE